MGEKWSQTMAGTLSQSGLPLRVGPEGRGTGPGRELAEEPGQLQGGRALTRGRGQRARRGPSGEGAGALPRAQEGSSGVVHSDDPGARAARHRHR